jgi:hypothetical protein
MQLGAGIAGLGDLEKDSRHSDPSARSQFGFGHLAEGDVLAEVPGLYWPPLGPKLRQDFLVTSRIA